MGEVPTGVDALEHSAILRALVEAGPLADGVEEEVLRDRVIANVLDMDGQPYRFGRYILLETLGRGGMGTVLEAFDRVLDRRVAVKVLHAEFCDNGSRRLLREAQALAKLSHPNVVQVYEAGMVDGHAFVAMELIVGRTLREWMDQEPYPGWQECVGVFIQVGRGLAAAHHAGMVHRDFKPGNAIIDRTGRVRVLDFGLARRAKPGGDQAESEASASGETNSSQAPGYLGLDLSERSSHGLALDARMTRTGAKPGTPAYMSPEQTEGRLVDARSDQFSFCVSLWEALYGERPFRGRSSAALADSFDSDALPMLPPRPGVPEPLQALLRRGLAHDPDDRWPSMEALLSSLTVLAMPRSRRWTARGISIGLLGLGIALAMPQWMMVSERCTGARAQLAGVWNQPRREEVRDAILGTDLSYASNTWVLVENRLDDYVRSWERVYTEACKATRISGEQSEKEMRLRLDCLYKRKVALGAVLDVLAHADVTAVDKAVELVSGLPRLTRCDDVGRLVQQNQRVPPPEDPRVAEQVKLLRDQLTTVQEMEHAGRYATALTLAEDVVRRASALDYPPLWAEAESWRGVLLEHAGRYEDAEQALIKAHALALSHGHDVVVLHTAQSLTGVVGYKLSRHVEGRVWARTAVHMSEYVGDATDQAVSLNRLGNLLSHQGSEKQALRNFQGALALWEDALGTEHPDVTVALNNLGNLFRRRGDHEQAERYLMRALRSSQKSLGPGHPRVALISNNLGNVFGSQGDYEQADSYLRQSLRIFEEALGADHPKVAQALDNLGIVSRHRGDYTMSEIQHQRSLQIYEDALGPDYSGIANVRANLGNLLAIQGRYDQAEVHFQRAMDTWEATLGPEHRRVAIASNGLGNALLGQGDYDRAESAYIRSLRIKERVLGPDHPGLASTLTNLGNVFRRQGDYGRARAHYQQALRLDEGSKGPDHPEVAHSLFGLAEVALAQRDFQIAREHAERAVSIREEAGTTPELLAETRFVLAQVLWEEPSERARARTLAKQARDALAKAEGPGHTNTLIVVVERWLMTHRIR